MAHDVVRHANPVCASHRRRWQGSAPAHRSVFRPNVGSAGDGQVAVHTAAAVDGETAGSGVLFFDLLGELFGDLSLAVVSSLMA